ncbi:MAG: hypothetical protein IPK12_19570 [Gemmatimonadetes bacterium]|nr:hypothetical protein [Gemmatimonadota bacterium]
MPKPLTSTHLRRLAEEADGRRGEKLQLIQDPRTGELRFLARGEKLARGAAVVAEAATENRVPTRDPVKVSLTINGKKVDLAGADAIFWSESAIEKFMWPYYQSRGLMDGNMQTLQKAYYASDSEIVAIVHKWPSRSDIIVDTGSSVQRLVVDEREAGTGKRVAKSLRAHLAGKRGRKKKR